MTDGRALQAGTHDPDGALRVLVQRLDPGVSTPLYALPGDAGADVVAAQDITLEPGQRAVLPTGIAIAVPDGYAAFVHPRSGLAARAGLGLVNAPGTIDAGYRGELKVIVINHDTDRALHLARGDRVAQLVFQKVEHARFVEVDALPPTARGAGGHGSTGGAGALDAPDRLAATRGSARSGAVESGAVESEAVVSGAVESVNEEGTVG